MNKEPELVDLGLPSGNLWIKCNLNAKSKTDFGLYYQWGSTIGYQGEKAEKHSYWNTCPFNNGENGFDKEYFKTNRYRWIYKNNILRPEFDAVTQMYGNEYRMPTKQDFQELLDNTISKSIKNYENSGKDGRLFISKVNGKSIFIPFSGYTWDGSFYGVGSDCYLWSGELGSSNLNCACYLYCSSNITLQYDDSFIRICGLTIRGIKVRNE